MRNELALVYDVQFQFKSLDSSILLPEASGLSLTGGLYYVKLIGNSNQMNQTATITQQFLANMLRDKQNSIQLSELTDAINHVTAKLKNDRYSLQYWVSKLSGSQMSYLYDSLISLDYSKLLSSITIVDVYNLLHKIQFGNSNKEFVCNGISI